MCIQRLSEGTFLLEIRQPRAARWFQTTAAANPGEKIKPTG
jgi:hypothetical protein